MEKIAYLAGLIDGEGSFCIQMMQRNTPNFSARMSMSIKYGHEVLKELVQEFGGHIYYYKDNMARWHLGKREELEKTVKLLIPYLRIKKSIAERFLEALSIFPKSRKQHWTQEMINKVYDIAVNLNPNDSRKCKWYKQQ
jgi:phage pi2 protein 07